MADHNLALNPLPLDDPKGGAKSLTRVSGIGAAVVALLVAVDGTWAEIFDTGTPAWAKPIFMMVVVGAWAVIASADLVSRGISKGHEHDANGAKEAAAASKEVAQTEATAQKEIATATAHAQKEIAKAAAEAQKEVARVAADTRKEIAKSAVGVTTLPGFRAVDESGKDAPCRVAAVRVSTGTPDELNFLIIRDDGKTRWASAKDLRFEEATNGTKPSATPPAPTIPTSVANAAPPPNGGDHAP